MALNIDEIRSDFPILQRKNRSKPLAFLDNAATSQKPACVVNAISDYYTNSNSNVHRGVYELAEDAENLYHQARKSIALRFNVSVNQVIFVRGATEGLNLIAQSYGSVVLRKGDCMILSEMEHHANIVPWQILSEKIGFSIRICPTLSDGSLDREWISHEFNEGKVKLISLTALSNTLGTVNPIKEIVSEARQHGIKTVIDGAQSVPHQKIDFQKIGCDFFAFSGHKIYGPMGIGVVLGSSDALNQMPPYQAGGDMIDQVSFSGTTYASGVQRFEAGTPNVADAIGLGKAISYLKSIPFELVNEHEKSLLARTRDQLKSVDGLIEHGTTTDKAGVFCYSIEGVHPHDLATLLDAEGIATRTGHHCCQPLMERLGVEATARASFSMYNTIDEANHFADAVKRAVALLR